MGAFRDEFKTLRKLKSGKYYYSLPELKEGHIKRLPVSIRIMLESLLRNEGTPSVKKEDVIRLANWTPAHKEGGEVPFIVSRVILQDFTGVPLVVDLAAMRDAAADVKFDPEKIEPLVPVDLVVDHSVQVDKAGTKDAFAFNIQLEFTRNHERYAFLKWGEHSFKTFSVVPPGIGIVHQVNLEYLATVVTEKENLLYFDTLVGTDSHTTMINGLGIVGWGVGGIEAQAAMLGEPVALQMPDVIGVHMTQKLKEGVTATDLALHVTEMLRKEGVVDKFVEFFGKGVENLSVADRATIANMSPEYGATMGFFPIDEKTLEYLKMTGREKEKIDEIKEYLLAQNLFGIPGLNEIDYTKVLHLDLSTVVSSVSGPKRPQDRIDLFSLKPKFDALLKQSVSTGGYEKKENPKVFVHAEGKFTEEKHHDSGGAENGATMQWSEDEMLTNRPFTSPQGGPGYTKVHPADGYLEHGSVVIAAITSCTNTSNPDVLIAAGLLAKKACERGLKVSPLVKTSLAPGSRVVTEYLEKMGLQKYLDQLGFQLVGYGCTTCIGNSGPLDEKIEGLVKKNDLIVASVLSGNRNFEARIHSAVKANFLMSPPLVVAFAIAGKVTIDLSKEPLGKDQEGKSVFLKDIWPSSQEIQHLLTEYLNPGMFKERYKRIHNEIPLWNKVEVVESARYNWSSKSTYIQKPPYFEKNLSHNELENMRPLAIFGDSVTTDHISPAGAFHSDSPAGKYLLSLGVKEEDFNSYGSRRGNHNVMMRGTFANVRIKNKMADGKEGGLTKLMPEKKLMTIFEASQIYAERKIPLIVFAGSDYGMGSSRDWAAKGTFLLGVRAVVAKSFERIHRSNLIGMGVLPLQFKENHFEPTGEEVFTLKGEIKTQGEMTLESDKGVKIPLRVRIDTPIELRYYQSGGIMPYVLKQILARN